MIHLSFNENLKVEKSFYKTVIDIKIELKILRNLKPEGKMVILKTIAILKIVFQHI